MIAELLNNVSIEDKFNEIFNEDVLDNSEDDSVRTIDVDKVLKGRQAERNKKATVLKYLMANQHDAFNGQEHLVQAMFDRYDSYMTKEQIREAVNNINILLITNNGKTQRNAQTPVSSSESEAGVAETED